MTDELRARITAATSVLNDVLAELPRGTHDLTARIGVDESLKGFTVTLCVTEDIR
jgi:hypothetical protein